MKASHTNLLALVLLGVLIVIALSIWHPQAPVASAQTTPQVDKACDSSRSISVTGTAVINVVPDRALIQLGVETNGNTPDAARAENQQSIEKIIQAVRAMGVDPKDIATDYYIVYPVYENYDSMRIRGYRIHNTIEITLRKVELADDVIISALRLGANEVQNVQFYTSELRKYRDQARELATQAAGEKAQAMASAAGSQAGCVLSINEDISSQYSGSAWYYNPWWSGSRSMNAMSQNTIQNAAPSQGNPAQLDDSPVSLGRIAVRAEMSAKYSLK